MSVLFYSMKHPDSGSLRKQLVLPTKVTSALAPTHYSGPVEREGWWVLGGGVKAGAWKDEEGLSAAFYWACRHAAALRRQRLMALPPPPLLVYACSLEWSGKRERKFREAVIVGSLLASNVGGGRRRGVGAAAILSPSMQPQQQQHWRPQAAVRVPAAAAA